MFKKIVLAALLLVLLQTMVLAQSSPGLLPGQVPTAQQWNSYFSKKQDYPLPLVGCTGCGTAAFANTGTNAHTLGYLDGLNNYAAQQNFTGGVLINGVLISWPASGSLVGTTDAQTVSNKMLTASAIVGGTASGLTNLGIRSTGSGPYDLVLANSENLTSPRVLTFAVGDANRTLAVGANASVSGANTGDQTITLSGAVTGAGTSTILTTFSASPSFEQATANDKFSVASTSSGGAPGTISVSASGTTVTGTSTAFTSSFQVGQQITANGETHTVSAIASTTSMTTDAWTNAFSGAYVLTGAGNLWVFNPNGVLAGTLTASSVPTNTTGQGFRLLINGTWPTSLVNSVVQVIRLGPNFNQTSAAYTNQVQGISVAPTIGATNTQNWSNALSTGTGLVGVSSAPTIVNGASGTITGMVSFLANPYSGTSSSTTVTNVLGFQMLNPAANTITNLIGLQIASLTRGSNNQFILLGTNTVPSGNFGIYDTTGYNNAFNVGGGTSYFNGGISTTTGNLALTPSGTVVAVTGSITTTGTNVLTAPSNAQALIIAGRSSDNAGGVYFYQNDVSTQTGFILALSSQLIIQSTTGVLSFNTGGAEQARIQSISGATNYLSFSGSNGAAPSITTSGGNISIGSAGGTTSLTDVSPALPNITTGTNADFLCRSSTGVILLQTAACTISSLRFKPDWAPLKEDALAKVERLQVGTFHIEMGGPRNADPNAYSLQAGLNAENVAEVMPECAVYEDDMHTPKSYRQECVIAFYAAAIKQLSKARHAVR